MNRENLDPLQFDSIINVLVRDCIAVRSHYDQGYSIKESI